MLKKVTLWILVLSCMTTIFYFSSQEATESTKTSSAFIKNIVSFFDFDNSLKETEIEKITTDMTYIVRKGAHFSIYAFLSFLVALLMNEYMIRRWHMVFYSTLVCLVYACTDEIHQMFVKGRSAQFADVVTDTSGSFCGAVLVFIILHLIERRKVKKENR